MRILSSLILLLLAGVVHADSIPVTVIQLDKIWQKFQQDAPATVVSLNTPQLSSEIDAVVTTVRVKVGEHVSKGDILIELDCHTYHNQKKIAEAAVQRSTAQLAFARSQLNRAKNLKSKKSISDELLDQRKTELQVARADLMTQKHKLALADRDVLNCNVLSPFSGVVSERLVSEGAYANRGLPLLTVTATRGREKRCRQAAPSLPRATRVSSTRITGIG